MTKCDCWICKLSKKRSGKAFEHFGGPCNVNEKHELRTALQHEADEPKVIKWNRCHQWWLTTKEAETKAPARSLEITECKPHGQYSHRYITTIQEKSSFSLRLFVSCASFLFLAFICIRKFIVCFPEPLIYRFRQLLYFLVYFDIFSVRRLLAFARSFNTFGCMLQRWVN